MNADKLIKSERKTITVAEVKAPQDGWKKFELGDIVNGS